jgi:hypothetical protein
MSGRQFTTRIRRARTTLAAERARTAAERDAFEAFERRVGALSPRRPDRSGSPGALARSLSAESNRSPSMLDRVRGAYRETVLALDHYEEEYGESAIENLTAEFGEELGSAVAGSGVFTAELKAALVAAGREAAARRATFVAVIDEEREALDEATRELRDVGEAFAELDLDPDSGGERTGRASFTSLRERRECLQALGGRCEELVENRQKSLRAPRAGGQWRRNDRSLNEYLYADLDVTYPILADASEAAATLREAQRRIERTLTHTV